MRAQITFVSILALTGCSTLSHNPEVLSAPNPDRPESWKSGELASIPKSGDLIASLGDQTLTKLVSEALNNNPDLAISTASVRASRAAAAAQYGNRLPSINGGLDADWTSAVADINDNAVRSEGAGYGFSVGASWEPDFWGRISAGILAAEADLKASEADLQAAELSLAASTAISWYQLKEAVLQQALAVETLSARERTLQLTERRFRNGLTAALDVRLARSAVETAKAQLSAQKRATGEARRAIEVLLGRYPSNELTVSETFLQLPDLEGAGDPTSLLARRPDIAAAEARIAAAGFRVETARLALKPSLKLSASLFSSNDDIADLLDPSYLAGQIAASLTAPLYNGGRLKANIEAADAQAKITSARYVSTVLTAWQEVENAIAADALLAEQLESQLRAQEEAQLAENLAERQYQGGLSTIFNLIDAQTRRINADSSVISAQSARAINRVRFHLALGGELPQAKALATSLSGDTTNE